MQNSSDMSHPCRLYLVSPPSMDVDAFPAILRDALDGGDVGAFQLRLKDVPDAEIYAAARALIPLCRERAVAFILNDRPDIAAEVGADGVHLGQEDLEKWPVEKVQRLMGNDAVIGVSCHDSSHLAMKAGEEGADYVAFGAFFPTTSKSPEALAKYGTPTPETLEWWYQYTVVPCVAIGGILPQNCGPLVSAGADFVAVINGVWSHPKGPKAAVAEFNEAIKRALKLRKPAEAA